MNRSNLHTFSLHRLRTWISRLVLPAGFLLPAALAAIAGCAAGNASDDGTNLLLDETLVLRRQETRVTPMAAWNSSDDDFGVSMPLDSTVAYISSGRSGSTGPHSLFVSRRVEDIWTPPEPAIVINNESSNGFPSFTPGSESLYFAGHGYGFGDADLYRVDVGPRGAVPKGTIPWSIPTNLGLTVNGAYWDSQPCLSADGSLLYFSSDRPGGLGGRDIWVCRRQRDGNWADPINAGEIINTPFDEITPWLAPDGQTLVFASNGHPGLGSFDLFTATTAFGGVVVTNLGTPINSPSDDIAFSISSDGRRAFLTSNRSGGEGGYDIYRVAPVPFTVDPLMIVSGSVRSRESGKRIPATVEVTDISSDQMMGTFATDPETGTYRIILPRGYNYAVTAQAPDHLFQSHQVLVPGDLEYTSEQQIDFTLAPIDGTIRLLVFFPAGGSNLERESVSDLHRVVRFLKSAPDVRIEVAGHTSSEGDPQANMELSKERAEAVKSFLIGNRIEADRIVARGYGSSQPIADNDTEEGRSLNRRVEMRILQDRKGTKPQINDPGSAN